MPLIRGDIDPRLDKLKAWMIDLDYLDSQRRATGKTGWTFFGTGKTTTEFANLREEFFQVIRKLTPGLKIGKVVSDRCLGQDR